MLKVERSRSARLAIVALSFLLCLGRPAVGRYCCRGWAADGFFWGPFVPNIAGKI